MLSEITGFQAIYIYCGKCDLRKGIDGLATLVKEQFRLDRKRFITNRIVKLQLL